MSAAQGSGTVIQSKSAMSRVTKLGLSVMTISGKEFGLLPTLTVNGNHNRKGASKTSGDGLVTALMRFLPTLTAHDYRGGCKPERTAKMRKSSQRGTDLPTLLRSLNPESTGIINPCWRKITWDTPQDGQN